MLVFTEHRDPFGLGNRPSNPTLSKHSEHDDDDEDSFDEHVPGKNYDLFERKLAEGFLEAPNLNLISVPPAMFDYQPPLQVLHELPLNEMFYYMKSVT